MSGNKLEDLVDVIHGLFEKGEKDEEIVQASDALNHHLSLGAVARHRRFHLVKKGEGHAAGDVPDTPVSERLEPVDNIASLQQLIARGMLTIPTAKISPDLLVRAIDLEEKLTRGKKTDVMLEAIEEAVKGGFEMNDLDDEDVESPMDAAARLSIDPNED